MSTERSDLEYWDDVYRDSVREANIGRVLLASNIGFAAIGNAAMFESTSNETQLYGVATFALGIGATTISLWATKINIGRGDRALRNINRIFSEQ